MYRLILATIVISVSLTGCATPDRPQRSANRAIDRLRVSPAIADQLALAELESGGRLGVAWVAQGQMLVNYRGEDRFAMCSTFKTLLVAETLRRSAGTKSGMARTLPIAASDIIVNSPRLRAAYDANPAGARMSLAELSAAAIEASDNGAANLLLRRLGGPPAVTDYARRNLDFVTRLDRMEPELNENGLGDWRDSTTPVAMAQLTHRTVFGVALPRAARDRLTGWMVNATTGARRIRAGLPQDWRAGDKTGSCGTAFNDVAILWDNANRPSVLAIYLDRPTVADPDAVIAKVTALVTAAGTGAPKPPAASQTPATIPAKAVR